MSLWELSARGKRSRSLEVDSLSVLLGVCFCPGCQEARGLTMPLPSLLCLLLWGELVSFAFTSGLPGCWAPNSGLRAAIIEADAKIAPISRPSLWLAAPQIWAGLVTALFRRTVEELTSTVPGSSLGLKKLCCFFAKDSLLESFEIQEPLRVHELGTDFFKKLGRGKFSARRRWFVTPNTTFQSLLCKLWDTNIKFLFLKSAHKIKVPHVLWLWVHFGNHSSCLFSSFV